MNSGTRLLWPPDSAEHDLRRDDEGYELHHLILAPGEVGEEDPRTSAPAYRSRTTERAVRALPRRGTPKPKVTTTRVVADCSR